MLQRGPMILSCQSGLSRFFFNASPLRGEDRFQEQREMADLGDFRLNSVGFSSMLRTNRHCRMVSRWKL